MTIRIGNAPCSWGVEFADDKRNPTWQHVLRECAEAGYKGIELGPVGFMPEDPGQLRAGLDSISPRRAPTAGRADEAEQMDKAEWTAYRDRIAESARIGTEEYGLTVGIHAHAAGFMDFEPELERMLDEVDESILKICFDTGHHSYAGFDPVAFMKRHMDRISYMHFKDIEPKVKAAAIENRTGFYDACGQGIFCNLGEGDVDFPAVRQVLLEAGFKGWCTVEQDCDPTLDPDTLGDARKNREYLESIGFK